jgi:hypothetical protein
MKEIDAEERKGIWGKVTLDGRRKEALESRNRTCNAMIDSMVTAYNFVVTNNAYDASETINFDNPRLQSVLKTIDVMGKDLSVSDQMAILGEFRGDIGSLRVLEKAFAKNNLYMKSAAREMQQPIPYINIIRIILRLFRKISWNVTLITPDWTFCVRSSTTGFK